MLLVETSPVIDTANFEALLTLARKVRTEDFGLSEIYFQRALQMGRDLRDTHRQIRALNGAGITYGMQDKFAEAIRHFNEALSLALANGHPKDAATSYGSLGIVYKRMGEYTTSLDYYFKSNQLCDSIGNDKTIAANNENIGVLFDLMHEPEKAMEYYSKALDWYRKQEDQYSVVSLESNIALIYLGKEEYDEAIKLMNAALDYYEEHNMPHMIPTVQGNLGWTYYKKGDHATAQKFLKMAIEGAEKYKLIQLKKSALYTFAKSKADIGDFVQALEMAEYAALLADSINTFKTKADAAFLLAYVHEKSGNSHKALEYHKNFYALSDSVYNESKARSYKNLQVMMEVYEKDKQLEAQALEMAFLDQEIALESRWKWTLGVASLFLLLAGVLYYMKYRQRLHYSAELESKNSLISWQKKEIEEINRQLEKRMLRAQMNPHFIFNSLSSIQHFIIANDKVSALKYLSHFSNLLRQILESSVNINMALKDEIELIRIYLELESLRFENSFSYEIKVDENLDTEMLEIPTMIVQPFVENAILHGLMPKKGDRRLSIELKDGAQFITCLITDNGIGREAAERLNNNKTGKSKSRGISVTSQRLELLANNFDLKTEIQYTDLKDGDGKASGTQVEINIPKQDF